MVATMAAARAAGVANAAGGWWAEPEVSLVEKVVLAAEKKGKMEAQWMEAALLAQAAVVVAQ